MKYRALIFFLLFLAGAQGALAQAFVEEPERCLSTKHFPCALRSLKSSQKLQLTGASAVLDVNSTLVLYSETEWRLLEGPMWLKSDKKIQISSGVAQFSCTGDTWINKVSSEKIVVRNLKGDMQVTSSLLPLAQSIPVGFENWYSIINSNVHLGQGVLKPIEAQSFLPEWLKLAQLSRAQSIEYIKTYRQSWHGSVQASAELYQQVVTRQMASVENSEETQIEKQRHLQQEHEKLRQMYRERFQEDKAFRLAN